MATKQYKPVPVGNAKVYLHGCGGVLNSIVYSSHARHVSTWLIVPASHDEYTALVKSGNVANTRLESSQGCVLLVETWIP